MNKVEQACIMDGQFVGTFLIPFPENYSKKRKAVICALCRNKIQDGTTARFFGCNGKHFPNSICHPDCVEKEGGYQATAERLKVMNDRFKQLKTELLEEFGAIGWFRIGDENE